MRQMTLFCLNKPVTALSVIMKKIKYISLLACLIVSNLLFTASVAQAHEVWLERDASGPVRVYLGEPGEPDSGGDIDKLKGSLVFTQNKADGFAIEQKEDHWSANVTQSGDVRYYSESVWMPWKADGPEWWEFWKEDNGILQGGILEAKAGRLDTQAKLNLEFVPKSSNGDHFVLIFQGKPLAKHELEVLTPEGDTVKITTDDSGSFDIKQNGKGRYLVSTYHRVDGPAKHSGMDVKSLLYITSLTFTK